MAGRHRKNKAPQWKLPAGIAAAVATALPASMWLTTAGSPEVEAASAALALQAPPVSSVTPPPSTSSTPPSSSTTTPPPPTSSAPPKPTTSTKAPAPVRKIVPAATACSTDLGGTKPHVAQVGNHVKAKFGVENVGGVAGRANASDHPSGLALDFMVDTATGNAIADYLLANQKDFGVTYVIWRQRYNDGSGWDTMEDRGGATANHLDHVHVSFAKGAKVNVSC